MVDREEDSSKKENGGQENEATQESPFESAPIKPKHISITDAALKELQKELLDYKDKYLRLLADADNARKRLQKERQEIVRHAGERLIVDFLRPIDNLENALRFAQEMSEEVKNWAFGFQMILAQFKDVLVQNGVTTIESLNKPFNPHDHEAVEMIDSTTLPSGIVVEECVRGYRMGDRTIRAARVKVTKNPKNSEEKMSSVEEKSKEEKP